MSTAYLLVEGLNFPILLDRLKKHGVNVLEIENLSDKRHVIRVKYKDMRKVFAISQKMWYNKLIRLTGAVGVFDFLKRNLRYVVASLLFFALTVIADGYVFGTTVSGVSGSKVAKVYEELENLGVKRFEKFSDLDTSKIEKGLLASINGIDFVTVKKSGYKLVIDIICSKNDFQKVQKRDEVFSKYGGVLRELRVYSGTPLKSVGDAVCCGEKLAAGYYTDGDGNSVKTDCMVAYTVECAYEREFVSSVDSDDLRDGFIARTLFECGADVKDVIKTEVTRADGDKSYIFKVKITYIVTEE